MAGHASDTAAAALGGVFLIGCGSCLLLVGGGCTGLLIFMIVDSNNPSGSGSMLVLSLVIAAAGIFAIVQGGADGDGAEGWLSAGELVFCLRNTVTHKIVVGLESRF